MIGSLAATSHRQMTRLQPNHMVADLVPLPLGGEATCRALQRSVLLPEVLSLSCRVIRTAVRGRSWR